VLLVAFGILYPTFISAQSLDLSPEPDGTINIAGAMDWEYDRDWSGSLHYHTENTATLDESVPGTGLEQSLTTVQKQVSAELIPLAFKADSFSLGLSLKGDYLNIRESGFIDFRQFGGPADPIIRLFFNNLRGIYAVKPGLSLGWGLRGGIGSLSIGLSYAPLIWLALDQTLSTAAEGIAYDTPTTKHAWQGPSFNSFGALVKTSLDLRGLSLDLDSSLEGTHYEYEYLQIGGGIGSQSAWMLDGSVDLFMSLPVIQINGWIPRLGASWVWAGTFDQAPGSKPDMQTKWRLNLGFRGRT